MNLMNSQLNQTSRSVTASSERKAIVSLAILYSVRMLGLFMLIPVMTLYGTSYESQTPFLLGLALGIYGASQALLQIPFGLLSDRLGRKPLILVGLVLFVLGSVIAALADNVYGLIIGRFLQGSGAISSVVMALLADLTSEESRTKAMASVGASIGVSFAVAITLGPMLAAWGGISAIFWLTAIMGVMAVGVLLYVVPNVALELPPKDRLPLRDLLHTTFWNPQLLRLNLGVFVLHAVLMSSFVVFPLILQDRLEIARDDHGLVYLPLLGLGFLVMLPFMIVAEKRRQIKLVFLSAVFLLFIVQIGFIPIFYSRSWVLFALFVFFVAFNLLEAMQPSLVSKIASAGAKGTATGIYSTFQVLGVFTGGALGGWLLQHQGVSAVFILNTILVFVWMLIAWSMQPPSTSVKSVSKRVAVIVDGV
jgi:predicted MFS family arabinose efflux permease